MLNKQKETNLPVVHAKDEECEAAAAAAREEGTDMIRNHLGAHLALNPNSSYVSWIATLHPENASVTIDPRFMNPGNPWITVFEESNATIHLNGVPVDDVHESAETPSEHAPTKPRLNFGGLVPFLVGFSFCASGVLVALALEFASALAYLAAVAFQYLCNLCANPEVYLVTFLPFYISWMLLQVFRYTDVFLLIVNVIVVELLAGISWFLCGLLALDCDVGRTWHQQTRRLSHHTRWAFRVPFSELNPTRDIMIGCGGAEENDGEEEGPVTATGEVRSTNIESDATPVRKDGANMTRSKNFPDATPVGKDGENVIVVHHDDIMVVDREKKESSQQG